MGSGLPAKLCRASSDLLDSEMGDIFSVLNAREEKGQAEMSADHYFTTYYLTPDGWKEQAQIADHKRPKNCVEEWEVEGSQSHPLANEIRDWTCSWASPRQPRKDRDKLRERFPFPDEAKNLPNWVSNYGDPK
jgi:hypothetical protein